MSKTIQIASRHVGTINTKVKGEPAQIKFEQKEVDGKMIGLAMCDHDEASALLKVPGFWKVGGGSIDLNDGNGDNSDNGDNGGNAALPLVKEVVAIIEATDDIAKIDVILAADTRPGVVAAANKRKKQLTAPSE